MRHTGNISAGFILHSYPYKETSLILETFTRTHGRVAMVAKGVKRNGGGKYAINPFQPITLSWLGRAELKTLRSAEHEKIFPHLRGNTLMAAFYLNELILKLAVKEDPHELLFDRYAIAIESLTTASTHPRSIEVTLRRFELSMLAELGYGLTLTHEADSDMPIDSNLEYWYVVDRGPIRVMRGEMPTALEPIRVSGRTLIAMRQSALNESSEAQILMQAKQLMRRVLNHQLGDKALHTRQLIREMK